MADCYFKRGEYRTAILRFDDVVKRYPKGNKAADALYRQGEALMKSGPAYSKAARQAFEQVASDYPDSPRAAEARKQIEQLGGASATVAAPKRQ
jgi:TolA-binding protein